MNVKPLNREELEEHTLRVAKIHRRAMVLFDEVGREALAASKEPAHDFVRSIAFSIRANDDGDIAKRAQSDPTELIETLLTCGMLIEQKRTAGDPKAAALQDVLNSLPSGFSGIISALNEVVDRPEGDALMQELAFEPAVQEEYEQMRKDLGG